MLIIGSIAFDTISTAGFKKQRLLGGSAFYSSIAASFFAKPSVVGVVGEDFTKANENYLKKRGVDTSGIVHENGKTFAWGGVYNKDFNKRTTVFTHLNVFEHFNPILSKKQQNSKVVFLANIHPLLQMQVIRQLSKPQLIGFDTMNYWIEKEKKNLLAVLPNTDIIFINEEEAFQLTNKKNITAAMDAILGMMKNELAVKTVVIKRGEKGMIMKQGSQVYTLPAFPVKKVIDPTGAGDCFAGAFLGYLETKKARDWDDFCSAALYATTCASFCVEKKGVTGIGNQKKVRIKNRTIEFVKQVLQ